MWFYFGLATVFFLSLNNICKKFSVKDNAVFPLLLATNGFSLLYLVPVFTLSYTHPELLESYNLGIPSLSWTDHFFIAIKSLLMTISWVLAFFALKHLPLTIVSPIRSSGPFFTLIGALLIYGETPTLIQWLGFFLIIDAMLSYANIGISEGIDFKNNKWIWGIVGATIFGSSSGLYDKFLIQQQAYSTTTVQWWFFVYVVLFLSILVVLVWRPNRQRYGNFKWSWTIPCIGILMVFADFFYFTGLQDPEALIMLMSAIKRSQMVFTIIIGGLIFREKNKRQKLLPLAGVVLGVICLIQT
ncbi:DMT family transporter [Cyclobacteriaceae bacterium]|nr:DMT family transporter [Cyclobacteriaceae bacterium]